jgi:malate synthase
MPEFSMVAGGALHTDERGGGRRTEELERGSMPSLKLNLVGDDLRASGLARPAAEKFAGAWLACFLVMARGDILGAFSAEHMLLASICGTVGAVVTVALLVQMDRTVDSVARQATISAVATFIGDLFAHPSHFSPQWAEPLTTAAVSAAIAIALWYAKRWVRSR